MESGQAFARDSLVSIGFRYFLVCVHPAYTDELHRLHQLPGLCHERLSLDFVGHTVPAAGSRAENDGHGNHGKPCGRVRAGLNCASRSFPLSWTGSTAPSGASSNRWNISSGNRTAKYTFTPSPSAISKLFPSNGLLLRPRRREKLSGTGSPRCRALIC